MAAVSAKFGKLLDEFWDWRMKEFPEFAYFVGWKGKDHRGKLESYKVSAFEERKRVCEDYISRALDMKNDLTDVDRMNCESFIRELQDYVDGSAFKGYVFPINFLEGIQHELGRLADEWLTFDGPEDYDNLLETFKKAVPQQVDEIIELMRYGIKEGMVCHAVSMTGVVNQFDGLLTESLEDQLLLAPLKKFPSTMSEEDQAKYKTALTEALENAVFPALKNLRDFIADEYSTKFRPEIGSSTLPPGMAFYEQCLRFHTSTNLTPKQIHQMGLDEVERIETEMRKIIKETGSDDDIKTFMDKLREDKSFYFKSKEELMARFRELCDEIEPMLIDKKIFYSLPKSKLALKESRPEESGGPAAQYLSGTPDGSRPGVFYVNSNNYTHQPTYEMIPLALHEANPGHHLQGCYAMEKGTMPYFRQYLEDRKYSDTPSRFPMHTAYIEGWGLYSETLGHDLGLYKSPYDRFGHLSEDIFRACRLVVDTGLHAFGWTQEQAVQFMLDHSAASKENIENEVRRYITWPGQACAYKIGQLKLIELRRRATEAMKEAFDIRDFHEIVLCNNGHLDILERAVDEYIGRLAAVPGLQETHAGGVGVISGQ